MDIGPPEKEILHDGPNTTDGPSTNRNGSGMEASTRVFKIWPTDGILMLIQRVVGCSDPWLVCADCKEFRG